MSFLKYLPKFIRSNLNSSNAEHKAILEAMLEELKTCEDDIELFKSEVSLTEATGVWLNEWSGWFNKFRLKYENDEMLLSRSLASIIEPKVTIPALKSAVSKFLNSKRGEEYYTPDDIVIYEPYVNLIEFSEKGTYGGGERYPDGNYWDRFIIEIYLPEPAGEGLQRIVDKTKASGVKVLYSLNIKELVSSLNSVEFSVEGFIAEDTINAGAVEITGIDVDIAKQSTAPLGVVFNITDPMFSLKEVEPFVGDTPISVLDTISLGIDVPVYHISIVQEN